jgi:hypothetical protein
MKGSQKLLLVGGLALAIWGMSYGLWYAVFAEHQHLEGIGRSLATSFAESAGRNLPGAQAALEEYRATKYVYERHVDVHGHWIGLAMVLIVLAFAFDRVGFGERVRYWLALALLLGAITFPLGVLLQTADHGAGPKVIAVVGSALVIGSLGGVALGLWRERTQVS